MQEDTIVANVNRTDAASGEPPVNDEAAQTKGRLGWFLCWAVVFADLGTSVYYTPGILYQQPGVGAHAAIFVGLTLIVFIMLTRMYGEVAVRYPGGGGVTVAATAIHPFAGVLGGMLILVDYFLTAALSALSGIIYLSDVVPAIHQTAPIVFNHGGGDRAIRSLEPDRGEQERHGQLHVRYCRRPEPTRGGALGHRSRGTGPADRRPSAGVHWPAPDAPPGTDGLRGRLPGLLGAGEHLATLARDGRAAPADHAPGHTPSRALDGGDQPTAHFLARLGFLPCAIERRDKRRGTPHWAILTVVAIPVAVLVAR